MTTIIPEKMAKLRDAIAALQADDIEYECRSPWYFFDSSPEHVISCRGSTVAVAEEPQLAAYIAAADPQTVLALVEEVERLRNNLTDLLVCEADRRDLREEIERLRKENGKMRERLHHPCAGCPGCSSNDCPDALAVATLDMADMRTEIERLQARVAELESAMAQRMGVYAAPKDERQVGS